MQKKMIILAAAVLAFSGCAGEPEEKAPAALPAPELEEGIRGEQFGIDKNVNEKTIDMYLGRDDAVYRDMRMLKDEAEYEAIGGDSYLSGYVDGFEVVPYPYLVNVEGLPPEVGAPYSGETLFTHDEDGYTANYLESMDILEYLFPKDKYIILMCGGGGYAGMTKGMLAELGWDPDKIYNTGGFWFYEGENKVTVKREENGNTFYDFYKVPYHLIDFSTLHRTGEAPEGSGERPAGGETSSLPAVSAEDAAAKADSGDTFALSVSLPGCVSCASFAPVIGEYAANGLVDVYGITLSELKDKWPDLAGQVEYTPAVVIFENGGVKAVLRPDSDADLPYYKSTKALSEWFHEHLGTAVVEGNETAEIEECDDACTVDIKTDD